MDSRGGYSLRAYAQGSEDPSRDLLAVGVVKADGIVAIHPEGLSAAEGEQGAPRPSEVSCVRLPYFPSPLIHQSAWK